MTHVNSIVTRYRPSLLLIAVASWLVMAAGARDAASKAPPDLDRIVHAITTVIEHADGTSQSRIGTGFVIGSTFYTVHHNLTPDPVRGARVTTYLDGVALDPARTDAETDLAVFELPERLCSRLCNDLTLERVPDLRENQGVRWLRKVHGDHRWRSARVLNYALLGSAWGIRDDTDPRACDQNLIVEVDTPFISGSSGSPVLDADSGQIVGIIQGSLHREGAPSGFFKPIDCVLRFADAAR